MAAIKYPPIIEIYRDIKSKWILVFMVCILVMILSGWYWSTLNSTHLTKISIQPWSVIDHSARNCNHESKLTGLENNYEKLRSLLYCAYGKDDDYDRKLWRIVKEFLISKKMLNSLSSSNKREDFWPISMSDHNDRMDFLQKNLFIKARIDSSLEDVEVSVVLPQPSLLPRRILSEVIYETNLSLKNWWLNYWVSRVSLDKKSIEVDLLSSYIADKAYQEFLKKLGSELQTLQIQTQLQKHRYDLKNSLQHYFSDLDNEQIAVTFSKFKHKITKDTIKMSQLRNIDGIMKLLNSKSIKTDLISGKVTENITKINLTTIVMLTGLLTFLFVILIFSFKKILLK